MSGLPEFIPPSAAKVANPAKAPTEIDSCTAAKPAKAAKATPKVSNFSNPSNGQPAENDNRPLAAKLRALGQPIALEVDGEVFCWLVADDEAAQRADVDDVVCTAAEAEVLAQFDADGIRDLTKMKAALGGTLTNDEDNR